jgi:hypothetical protein
MIGITGFIKKPQLMWYFIPLEIINVFYVPIIAVAGTMFKISWKDRKV